MTAAKTKPNEGINFERDPMAWRIRDWDRHFENHRTRALRHLTWIPIPNKQDGDGYTFLLDHRDGAAHYGAWLAIVLIASKCNPRGWLVRDELETDPALSGGRAPDTAALVKIPHSIADLARISRVRAQVYHAAITRLLTIGWLETIPPQIVDALRVGDWRRAGLQSGAFRRARAGVRARAANGTERNGNIALTPTPALGPTPATNNRFTELAGPIRDWDRQRWQAVLEFARALADRLPAACRPLGNTDRNELLKIGALKFADVLADAWIDDAIAKANRRSTRKPLAAFHATLAGKCADTGTNFNRSLKAITIPDWFEKQGKA